VDELDRREFLALCGQGAALAAGAGLLGHSRVAAQDAAPAAAGGPVVYAAKDYSKLRGLRGLTDDQLQVHLELYAGYVKRTNALLARLWETRAAADAAWQELRRRAGWEWNGMRLHELYFDGLTKDARPLADDHPFAKAVTGSHGSAAAWLDELMQTARLPGVGWAIAYQDLATGQVLNTWVESHEEGHLAGARPLVVLDVWEHAWTAYRRPTERAAYLQDWLANVDWSVVAGRMEEGARPPGKGASR
jgi:superoxide dismutase, Fe-Mn family